MKQVNEMSAKDVESLRKWTPEMPARLERLENYVKCSCGFKRPSKAEPKSKKKARSKTVPRKEQPDESEDAR